MFVEFDAPRTRSVGAECSAPAGADGLSGRILQTFCSYRSKERSRLHDNLSHEAGTEVLQRISLHTTDLRQRAFDQFPRITVVTGPE